VNESLPSPPVSAVQNHRLPQILSESPEQDYYAPMSRLVQVTSHTGVTVACSLLICLITYIHYLSKVSGQKNVYLYFPKTHEIDQK